MKLQLRQLWKLGGDCPGNNCPSLYKVEGGYVVQGKVLDADARAQLAGVAADEDAVFVSDEYVTRLMEQQ